MIEFLKKLYERRFKKVTVIVLDDSRPDEDNFYEFKPTRLFFFLYFF